MNAIDLLKRDHKTVRALLDDLVSTTNRAEKTRRQLLERIHEELSIHTTIEEEIFYPAFGKADGSDYREMVHEAREEHRAVDKLVLPDLEGTDVTSEQFAGRAKVLKELIEHHAQEEEKEMFVKARKALSKDELEQLGERMEHRKAELSGKRK